MNQTTATTLTRTFEDDGTISLLLDNARGDVDVHADAAPGTAAVELRADREVDFETVELSCRGGRLTVDVPPLLGAEGSRGFSFSLGPLKVSSGDNASVEVIVHVPHGADVEAKTRAGDISVTGTTGTTRVSTGSGDLRVQESGSLKADSGSGDIDLDLRAGRATVRAGTGTGDVEVRVPRETPVWLDLNTGLGDVTQRIDPVGPPAQGQGHLSVSVRSGTGDIVITH